MMKIVNVVITVEIRLLDFFSVSVTSFPSTFPINKEVISAINEVVKGAYKTQIINLLGFFLFHVLIFQ